MSLRPGSRSSFSFKSTSSGNSFQNAGVRSFSPESLIEIVEAMRLRDGVDALILGGTELSLIFRDPLAAELPVLDTTQIHVDAAVEWLVRD